jgi:hypothetical protein
LFSGLVWAYGAFRHHFNDADLFQEKILILRESVERERLRTRVAQEDMAVFRQQVASVIPEILKKEGKGEKGYPLRQLASVTAGKKAMG